MNAEEIHGAIKDRFNYYTKHNIANNSVIDLYSVAVSEVMSEVYKEIEEAKMPHLYTKLKGESIDDLGFLMNTPREINESDSQYLYRLMNWKYIAESSNLTAINTALLNRTYASYAEFLPKTRGSGTGSVYIIPKSYIDTTVVEGAIQECMDVISRVASPGIHVDYTIPGTKEVILNIGIRISEEADKEAVKNSLFRDIESYINNIAPMNYMMAGVINQIGVNKDHVEFFNTLQIFVNQKEKNQIEIMQQLDEKFILGEIVWTEE